MSEGLSTAEVARAAGVTYRQLDHWTRQEVIAPSVPATGTGTVREWAPGQVRVVRLLSVLRDLGAPIDTLRAVAPTAEALESVEGRGVWGATMLVTRDGRMLSPLTCNEDGWLVRLSKCRDLSAEVRRLALVAAG